LCGQVYVYRSFALSPHSDVLPTSALLPKGAILTSNKSAKLLVGSIGKLFSAIIRSISVAAWSPIPLYSWARVNLRGLEFFPFLLAEVDDGLHPRLTPSQNYATLRSRHSETFFAARFTWASLLFDDMYYKSSRKKLHFLP
ncbi:MAG: hypothetical protein IJU76_14615, partial [Desulfovibrionaceae bacterium]|nr:hypothetical protein [Desulfovibrionaceae bacterium]